MYLKFSRLQFTIMQPKRLLGFGNVHWQQGVADLDVALNKWVDRVPEYCELKPSCVHLENLLTLLEL